MAVFVGKYDVGVFPMRVGMNRIADAAVPGT